MLSITSRLMGGSVCVLISHRKFDTTVSNWCCFARVHVCACVCMGGVLFEWYLVLGDKLGLPVGFC